MEGIQQKEVVPGLKVSRWHGQRRGSWEACAAEALGCALFCNGGLLHHGSAYICWLVILQCRALPHKSAMLWRSWRS